MIRSFHPYVIVLDGFTVLTLLQTQSIGESHAVGCLHLLSSPQLSISLSFNMSNGTEDPVWKINPLEKGSAFITLQIVGYLLGILGTSANAYVLIIILSCRSLRRRISLKLMTNLVCTDLLMSVSFFIHTSVIASTKELSGLRGSAFCKFIASQVMISLPQMASTFGMISLSAERYLMIVHPVLHRSRVTRPKTYALICFLWTMNVVFNGPYAALMQLRNGYCWIWEPVLWQKGFLSTVYTLLSFVLPLVLITYFYGHMLVILRKRAKIMPTSLAAAELKSDQHSTQVQMKVFKTMILVALSFLISRMPIKIYFILFTFGYGDLQFNDVFYSLVCLCVLLNCFSNPMMFALRSQPIRARGKHISKCFKRPKQQLQSDIATVAQSSIGTNA